MFNVFTIRKNAKGKRKLDICPDAPLLVTHLSKLIQFILNTFLLRYSQRQTFPSVTLKIKAVLQFSMLSKFQEMDDLAYRE